MPIVIIAILGIALVLYARKRNSDEIRRIREKAEVMPRCTSRGLSARHGRSRSGVRAGPSMSR